MPPNGWVIPSVTPGFANDCAQASTSIAGATAQDGATYDAQWKAIWNGPALDDIAITSFNEWHEGTQIEPAGYGQAATGSDVGVRTGVGARYQDYGSVGAHGYLYRTNDWVRRFAASPLPSSFATRTRCPTQLGAVNIDDGLSQLDTSDGQTTAGVAMGRAARASTPTGNPRRYMYFSVQNQFAYALAKKKTVTVTVTLLDTGGGPVVADVRRSQGSVHTRRHVLHPGRRQEVAHLHLEDSGRLPGKPRELRQRPAAVDARRPSHLGKRGHSVALPIDIRPRSKEETATGRQTSNAHG